MIPSQIKGTKYVKFKQGSKDEYIIALEKYCDYLESQLKNHGVSHHVSTRFLRATESADFIVKGRIYVVREQESNGYYIIDESGEETYYHHSCFTEC